MKGSSSISKDPALHFNYHPQRPLITNGIQKAKARAELCRVLLVGWLEMLQVRREDKARAGFAAGVHMLQDMFHLIHLQAIGSSLKQLVISKSTEQETWDAPFPVSDR